MRKSQFDAGTFGVGELITQRKLFRVPRHQRSYAWSKDAVTTFLQDVETAFTSNAAEYFIGLVVIQGPEDGEWILLDGQQRLTTSTMLFAAIRNWLHSNGLVEDARQIETEFLGVRRLGGEYSSRMQLNEENQEYFSKVVGSGAASSLKSIIPTLPKKSSNRLLLDAAIECQAWVNNLATSVGGDVRNKAERLFRLSSFIESRVKVVCVEVSSDVDAYILFESLNDRGIELSALDLLKNYAYSKSIVATVSQFDKLWQRLVAQLDDRNPDEFLKISWTAKHGVVQKTQLFRHIRNRYRTQSELLELLSTLANDAAILAALDDSEHVMWNDYPVEMRNNIYVLTILGGKQTRPVLLAAVSSLSREAAALLSWYLIVVIIRFQIIGRGRTGIMEKVFGRLCSEISAGSARDDIAFRKILDELEVPDEEFIAAFANHRDSRISRFAYFLAAIEGQMVSELGGGINVNDSIRELLAHASINEIPDVMLIPQEEEESRTIGAYALFRSDVNLTLGSSNIFMESLNSEFMTTMHVSEFLGGNGAFDEKRRSLRLAEIAARVWSL